MKRLLLGTAIGFVVGALGMAFLAQRASGVFFAATRANYGLEEGLGAVCAKRDGNMNDAVVHYANLLSANSSDGWWASDTVRKEWTLAFPVRWGWFGPGQSPLEIDAPESRTRRREGIEGMYRALLADALQKAGRHPEAEVEYARAATLLGDTRRVELVVAHPPESPSDVLVCDQPLPRMKALEAQIERLRRTPNGWKRLLKDARRRKHDVADARQRALQTSSLVETSGRTAAGGDKVPRSN